LEDANLEMAFKACTFAAVGTCGQRCTTLRRLLIHDKHFDAFVDKLIKAYKSVKIGDPLDSSVLCGPLNNSQSLNIYQNALEKVKKEGGKVLYGGNRLDRKGYFVEPTIVEAPKNASFLQE
jgi:acyl-CoA reductase-like NAD-dependent aldehyde dehydrogenase